jgi:hypothetical protein
MALDAGDHERVESLGKCLAELEVASRRPATPVGAALWYAKRGLRVFPLMVGLKTPYKGTHGLSDASCDPPVVAAMFAERSALSNVGIATGHEVDVIDIDGPVGVESMVHELFSPGDDGTWQGPPMLGVVCTPRPGGKHIYIAAVPGHGNRAHMLAGIDHRGLGGYVVAPPSYTEAGRYVWTRPLDLSGATR